MNIKNYLWLLPFCSFILGYSITSRIFDTDNIPTPHLIGNYIHEVLPLISQHKLNLRLIDQKEEADIPEGIIISQTPQPGKAIKHNQHIFIVTTKKPSAIKAPSCLEKNVALVLPELHAHGIYPRIYKMAHFYPENVCFAQHPEPEENLEKNRLTLYISAGNKKPVIWPQFIGMPLETVSSFLHLYGIQPYIINDSPYSSAMTECTIVDQRPLPGTLITLDEQNPLSVQLRIR